MFPPRTTISGRCRLAFACVLCIAANSLTLGAQQPVDEFILVNAAPGIPIAMPVAANAGFDARHGDVVAKVELYLGDVARHFQQLGLAAPRLNMTAGRNGGEAFVVRMHDYPDTSTHARYSKNGQYIEVDLSRAVVEDTAISDDAMEALAHELFHAVQNAYNGPASSDHGDWIIEGQAQAIGMDAARHLRGVDVHKGKNDDYRIGGRQYFRPLSTNTAPETYRTASFWRYLAETSAPQRRSGAGSGSAPVDPDYRYVATLLAVPRSGAAGEDADLIWLDEGLREATGEGLAHHYGRFAATLAGYVKSRLTSAPSGTAEQARESWLTRLFAPCPAVHLTATSPSGTLTAPLRQNAARCINVTADAAPAAQRAGSGSSSLRRLRGGSASSAEPQVDVVIQARSDSRRSLEALWLGMAGGDDAEAAYVGRDPEGYVADWGFSMPAARAQAFVISNMADDPTQSRNQDVRLTVFTSAARMTSSASGLGSLAGGPIDLTFDRFPTRDILSTVTETQRRAGIARPCMVRLHMNSVASQVDIALELDNDGQIQPGTFNVSDGTTPEKSPGQFVAFFSFGSGRERVSYRAEGGSVELTAFSPHLLKGTATLLGRLPKRVYGQTEAPWPETMSVRTEFTVIPRVNLGSSLFRDNFCFEPIGAP